MIKLFNSSTKYGGSSSGVSPQADKARSLFKQALQLYDPNGAYLKGIQAALDRSQKKAVASGMSNLVSSGLANTSMVGGLANRFMEETAVPTLANAESTRAQRMADILLAQANFEANLPDVTRTTTIGRMSPGILTRDRMKSSTGSSSQPGQQPAVQLPRLNLRLPSQASASTPTFSQAFIGDPNVYANDGRRIGARLTGTYDLKTGKLLDKYNTVFSNKV